MTSASSDARLNEQHPVLTDALSGEGCTYHVRRMTSQGVNPYGRPLVALTLVRRPPVRPCSESPV
jgi:hypothetical protein